MRTARNIIAGAISGFGIILLLQQYSVAYPTGKLTLFGVAAGIAVQVGIAQLAAKPRVPVAAAVAEIETPPATAAAQPWSPTHKVPGGGLDAWLAADAASPPDARLDSGLGVVVVATHGDWSQIVCENGWTAWVDGRALEVWT